jgi:hypothetical protein
LSSKSQLVQSIEGEPQARLGLRCKPMSLVSKRLTHILARYCECYSLEELLEPDELDEMDELDGLDELIDGEGVGGVEGSGLSGGASFWGVGPEGSGHEPTTVMPKILTQGRWNLGSCGKVGQLNSTSGTSGRFQTISGSHVGQGKMMGTIVVE